MFLIQRRGSWRGQGVALWGPRGSKYQLHCLAFDRILEGLLRWLSGKEPTCQCRRHKRPGFNPWDGKISRRRAWQPTPAFLPGEPHGQKSLVGTSPWGHKETDTTEAGTHAHTGSWTMKGTSVSSPGETSGQVSSSNDH